MKITHLAGALCALASSAICQITIPTHASTYNGFSRGFSFTAKTNFFINKLDLPPNAKQTGDTASYMIRVNGTELLRSVGNSGALTLATPLQIYSGNVVDIIGNWSPKVTSNFSAHNSYGSTAPYNTMIEGVAHVLNRAGWQWDIGDTAYKSGSGFNGARGSIGRVLVHTKPDKTTGMLTGSPSAITLPTGGTHTFSLDAGTRNAGRLYWIFGSVTGTRPGVTLASAIGLVNIPLNPDLYTDLTISLANTSLWNKTRGTLDASGKATASLNVPKRNILVAVGGVKFYHAYLIYDARSNFYGASNPVELTITNPTSPAPNGITIEANGSNSFNSVTTSGFFSVQNTGTELITEITFDWAGVTGQGSMEFDCDQSGMADRFWFGNGSGTSPCRGTYRNGSDTATGLVYDASNTLKQTCGAKTFNCGFIATNRVGTAGADYKTIKFRFAIAKFGKGKKFEFDSDTDGGMGTNGGSMAGMKITIKTASKTLTGALVRISANISRQKL